MATCKDCIHYNLCRSISRIQLGWRGNSVHYVENVEEICKDFKDHSRFVDIAEVKRKIIRPLCNRCAALTDCQTCPACALEIREHCEHYKEAEQAVKERNSE